MLKTIIFYIPSILCILFAFQYFFRKRNHTQRYMMYLLFAGTPYFVTYALYVTPTTDYYWLVRADCLNEPLFLCVMSLFIAYIHLHIRLGKSKPGVKKRHFSARKVHFLVMPAIAFGAINLLVYYLIGFDMASELVQKCDKLNITTSSPEVIEMFKDRVSPSILKLFGFFNHSVFEMLAIIYSIILGVSCVYCSLYFGYRLGDVFRFFCKGHTTTPAKASSACTIILIITMAPLIVLGRTYFVHNEAAGIAMSMFISISLFILCNAEMMSDRKKFSVHDITGSSMADMIIVGDSVVVEKEVVKEVVAENPATDILAVRTKHIIEKMKAAFEDEKAYANAELTVGGMAEMLGTNRTTLSNIVNQQYGVTFRDLVNRYRVDAAKAFIKNNPTATQEEIAVVCGFRSASALNHKFKEIVGMPPTLWLTTLVAGEEVKG